MPQVAEAVPVSAQAQGSTIAVALPVQVVPCGPYYVNGHLQQQCAAGSASREASSDGSTRPGKASRPREAACARCHQ